MREKDEPESVGSANFYSVGRQILYNSTHGKKERAFSYFFFTNYKHFNNLITIEQFKSGERLIDLHRPIPVSLNWTETKVEHGIGLCWNEYASTKISQLDNQYKKILSNHSVEWFHNIKIKHLKKTFAHWHAFNLKQLLQNKTFFT